jgi:hypothetical protein
LDEVHPFSDTNAVDVILREANHILSPNVHAVGRKNASRIWGFMSKFAMLDRFSKTLGVAKLHPGISVPRKTHPKVYFGTGSRVSELLKNAPYFSQLVFSP